MSNDLIIKWKNRCGSACILFLIAVLSLASSSFAQDPESSKKPSDESESDSGDDPSSKEEEGSGDNEQTGDSTGSTPVESEQNPSGGENVTPAGPSPSVPTLPPSLSFAVPDVAGKAFDVKRDSGTL